MTEADPRREPDADVLPLALARLAFWHPVGPHTGESWSEILRRKHLECETAGETFWTFQSASAERVAAWRREIEAHGGEAAALCVFSAKNLEPGLGDAVREVLVATRWRPERDGPWQQIPATVRPTHHRRQRPDGEVASAFRISRVQIVEPAADLRIRAEVLVRQEGSGEYAWAATEQLPRGEKLVRFSQDQGVRMRRGHVAAILHLKAPWVVWVGMER